MLYLKKKSKKVGYVGTRASYLGGRAGGLLELRSSRPAWQKREILAQNKTLKKKKKNIKENSL
jgi:hypothetical protein